MDRQINRWRTAALRAAELIVAVMLGAVTAPAAAQAPPGLPPVGMPYGNYFAPMKAKLKMTPAQDAQYTVALKATVKANDAARKARTAAAEAARTELAKAEPDFERLLNLPEEFSEFSTRERKAANAEWVRFTRMLSAEQTALVRSQLLDRVSRAENLREKFRQRHGG